MLLVQNIPTVDIIINMLFNEIRFLQSLAERGEPRCIIPWQWSSWECRDPDLSFHVTPTLFHCPAAGWHLHLSTPIRWYGVQTPEDVFSFTIWPFFYQHKYTMYSSISKLLLLNLSCFDQSLHWRDLVGGNPLVIGCTVNQDEHISWR